MKSVQFNQPDSLCITQKYIESRSLNMKLHCQITQNNYGRRSVSSQSMYSLNSIFVCHWNGTVVIWFVCSGWKKVSFFVVVGRFDIFFCRLWQGPMECVGLCNWSVLIDASEEIKQRRRSQFHGNSKRINYTDRLRMHGSLLLAQHDIRSNLKLLTLTICVRVCLVCAFSVVSDENLWIQLCDLNQRRFVMNAQSSHLLTEFIQCELLHPTDGYFSTMMLCCVCIFLMKSFVACK